MTISFGLSINFVFSFKLIGNSVSIDILTVFWRNISRKYGSYFSTLQKGFALIMENNTSEPVSQQEQVQKPILFYYNDAYYI